MADSLFKSNLYKLVCILVLITINQSIYEEIYFAVSHCGVCP